VLVTGHESGDVRDAYRYCQQIIHRASKTFTWGSRLLPPQKRRAAWAIYAFCRVVDDIADETGDVANARSRLEAWRLRLERVYAGTPDGPIMLAWLDVLQQFDVPLQPALDLIDGVEMDLAGARPQTFDDLRTYCYRVAGTVGLLMAPVLGYRSPAALPYAVDLGIAMQLTNILRDVGADARNGRIYLPQEDLDRFGCRVTDIMAGKIDDAFIALMRFQIARAQHYYDRAMPGIAMLDRQVQFAIYASANLYRGILAAIVANSYDVFTRRAYVSPPAKMLLLARSFVAAWQSANPATGEIDHTSESSLSPITSSK
jgi:15-cis-phytoene synthase